MNEQAVRAEIEKTISNLHRRIGPKAIRKQFAAGKAQKELLANLGIIDLMPAGFGHSDARAVIDEAYKSKSAAMNRYGEGEEIGASKLYTLLHQKSECQLVAFLRSFDWTAGRSKS